MSRRVSGGDFAERERVALEVANELVREELIASLNTIVTSQGTGDLSVDGVRYRWHAEGSAKYHSLVGPLEIKRPSFRKADERNGPTCIPLELAAGLVERATPALAERVAMGRGDGPSLL
ncbi:MAG: hypothetical protein KF901_15045 [Myxococcales bacterium]|nr:hypothetical protein [Myxococcales bacterium]